MESHEGHVGPGVGLEYPRTEKMEVIFNRRFSIFINGWKFPLSFHFFWGACSDKFI